MKQCFTYIMLVTLLVSCGNKNTHQAAPPRAYPVVAVVKKDVVAYQYYPVKIQGVNNNDVRAKISGYIKEMYVDEGQRVKRGQPLFRLETNVLSQTADAARSGIQAASANVQAAKASVNAAQVEVDKLVPLVEKKIISDVQLQTARANLMVAQSQLQQAQAGYAQAKANYQGIQANIDFSVVTSPINGVVGMLPLKVGSLVGPTDPVPLTTISDTREVYAYFSMNESEYLNFLNKAEGKTIKEKLAAMPPVELELANGNVYPQKGKIETVSGQIDPSAGTIQFRVGFPNAGGLLNNGSSGSIRIPQLFKDVMVVPESATYEEQGITYLYAFKKDTAYATTIDLITRVNNLAVIRSGVATGDSVIASGVGTIRNRSAVRSIPSVTDSIIANIQPSFK